MILHKPFDDLEKEAAERLRNIFLKYVHGLHHDKKRRTVFISCGTQNARILLADVADYEWDLSRDDYPIFSGLRKGVGHAATWLTSLLSTNPKEQSISQDVSDRVLADK